MKLRVLYEDDTEEEFKHLEHFYYIFYSKTLNLMYYGDTDWQKRVVKEITVISVLDDSKED